MRLCQHTHTHTILNAVILWPPHNPEAPPPPLQQTALSLKIFNSRADQRVKKHSELLDPSPGLPSTFSFIHLLRRVWSGTHYVALAGLDLTMQIKMAPCVPTHIPPCPAQPNLGNFPITCESWHRLRPVFPVHPTSSPTPTQTPQGKFTAWWTSGSTALTTSLKQWSPNSQPCWHGLKLRPHPERS